MKNNFTIFEKCCEVLLQERRGRGFDEKTEKEFAKNKFDGRSLNIFVQAFEVVDGVT